MHATTWSNNAHLEPKVNTVHMNDPELITELEDKIKVWEYLMIQYNLKPGFKIQRKRCNCSNRQVGAIAGNGHLAGNGSKQSHTRGLSESIDLALVLERKANW
jgi:hypothetical protein